MTVQSKQIVELVARSTINGDEAIAEQHGTTGNPDSDNGRVTPEQIVRYGRAYVKFTYNTANSGKNSLLHKGGLSVDDTFVTDYFGSDKQDASGATWRVVSTTLKSIGTVEYVNGTGLLIHGAFHVFCLVVPVGGRVDVRCVGVKLDGSTTGQNSLLVSLRDAARALKWVLTGCGTLALNSTLDMTKANLDWALLKVQAITPFTGTQILLVGGDTSNSESLKVSVYVWGDGPSWSATSSDAILATNSALTGVRIVDDNSGNSNYEAHVAYCGIACELYGNTEKQRVQIHAIYCTLVCKETEAGSNSPDTNEIWLVGTDCKRLFDSAESTSAIVHYLFESTIDDGTSVVADHDGVTLVPVSESKFANGKFHEKKGRRRGANRRVMDYIDKAQNGGVDGVLYNNDTNVHVYGISVWANRVRHLKGRKYIHDSYNGRSSIKANASATGNLLTFYGMAGTMTNATKLAGTGGLNEVNAANVDFVVGDTIIINGTTITVQASGATSYDVNITDDIGTLAGKIQSILRAVGGTGAVSTCVWQFSTGNNKIAITTQDTNQLLSIGGTAYSKIGLAPGQYNIACPAVLIGNVVDGAFEIYADKIYNRECVQIGIAGTALFPTNVDFGLWSISMGDPDPANGVYAPTTTNAVRIEKMTGGSISPMFCHGNIKLEAGCQGVTIHVSDTWIKCGYKVIADPAATYSLRVHGRLARDDFFYKAWIGNGFSVDMCSTYGVGVARENGIWNIPAPQRGTSAELQSISHFLNAIRQDGLLVKDTTLGKILQAAVNGSGDPIWSDTAGTPVHATVGYQAATTAFLARMGVAPSTVIKNIIDACYFEIGSTILAKLSTLWLPFVIENEADARLDLINTKNLIPYSNGSAVVGTATNWADGVGYKGDLANSAYQDTQYDPTVSPLAMSANSISLGIMMLSDSSSGLADLQAANNKGNLKGRTGGNGSFAAGETTTATFPTGASVPWFAGVTVINPNEQRAFINDQKVYTGTITTTGLPSRFSIGKSDRTWGAAFTGGGLTDSEFAQVYRAILHAGQAKGAI